MKSWLSILQTIKALSTIKAYYIASIWAYMQESYLNSKVNINEIIWAKDVENLCVLWKTECFAHHM